MKFLLSTFAIIILVILVASAAITPEDNHANEAARLAEQQQAREQAAKQQAHDDAVDRCMGPGAGDLRPRDYSAMLDACERDNVEYDPQVEAEVEKRIAEARAQLMEQQEGEPAHKQALQQAPGEASSQTANVTQQQ